MCDFIEMDSILHMFDDLEIDLDYDLDTTEQSDDVTKGEDEDGEL